MLTTVLSFLLALAILVTIHEFGHFYIARLCGVKVLRFSIGFGRPIFSFLDRHGTEFVVAAIPLGGYVKMLDEREGEVAAEELPQAFSQKNVWQRMAVVVAGPVANFILAIFFYFILATIGFKGVAPIIGKVEPHSLADTAGLQDNTEIVSIDGKPTPTWTAVFEQLMPRVGDTGAIEFEVRSFSGEFSESALVSKRFIDVEQWLGDHERPNFLSELGLKPYQPKTDWVIQQIVPDSPAEEAGLKVGDRLIASDGQKLRDWSSWVEYVRQRPEQVIELEINRNGEQSFVEIIPVATKVDNKQVGKVGLGTNIQWPEGMVREINYSLLDAVGYGFQKTWDQSLVILGFLKKLITLDISAKNMGGAFTIAQVAGDTASAGLTYFLSFLAFFSVSLGVFNLLPIPVLDGGHLLFYIVEAIKGKPLPEKIQMLGYQVGFFIIISVMVIAHYNDLMRMFS
jgi:regulator of sigma E protease